MKTLSEPTQTRTILSRVVLLIVGCLPIICVYVQFSVVILFGILIAGVYFGLRIVSYGLLAWLVATALLLVLIFSSATFRLSRQGLPFWQLIGLLGSVVSCGVVAFRFGHHGAWILCISAGLASVSSASIIFSAYNTKKRQPNKPEMATPRKPSDQF